MFDPEKFYRTDDQALLAIARPATMARWRHEKVGPSFVKFGKIVAYKGHDLLVWIESRKVKTDQK